MTEMDFPVRSKKKQERVELSKQSEESISRRESVQLLQILLLSPIRGGQRFFHLI